MQLLIEMMSEAGIRTSGQGPSAYLTTGSHSGTWLHGQFIYIYAAGSLAGQSLSLSLYAYALGYLAGHMDSLYIDI